MTINEQTTLAQLQIELGKLGVDHMMWSAIRARHVVSLHGPAHKKGIEGFGKSFIEALDDAFTSLVQTIGSELIRAD